MVQLGEVRRAMDQGTHQITFGERPTTWMTGVQSR